MAGQVRKLIDQVQEKRTKGNPALAHFVRAQLLLKGIDPDKYDERSDDNPVVIAQLDAMLREFN